ncbi:hypothetical protein F4804DRAFT_345145 [Jackrogersella minutella]|nr:hypothetical protein F4804DRAFT_345145 [Jackrogersella minutella]
MFDAFPMRLHDAFSGLYPSLVICQDHLETVLGSGFLDISKSGTPGRYRLLSCADFIKAQQLTILEYADFPKVSFAAISCVWRGNTPDKYFSDRTFNVPIPQVEGAEPGDPIGVEVLHEACVASLARGATHLWLDRFCIMQKSEDDKRWQISQMYEIYRRCHICIVLPGGVQCTVQLDEETQWIHRSWTLQEAVAPAIAVVLFSWRLGPRKAHAGDVHGNIEEVTPSKSAMASLSLIVDACTTGSLSIENDFPFWRETRRVSSTNVGALAGIMSEDIDQDAKDYLVHLAQRTYAAGDYEKRGTGKLACCRFSPPAVTADLHLSHISPDLCFWKGVDIKVEKGLQEVSLMMKNDYPIAEALVSMPSGSMDHEGYLNFTLKAIPIRRHFSESTRNSPNYANPAYFQALNESWWMAEEDVNDVDVNTFHSAAKSWVETWPEQALKSSISTIRRVEYLSDTVRSFEDTVSFRARWSIPQKTLEQHVIERTKQKG